jgi:hypothetical protein
MQEAAFEIECAETGPWGVTPFYVRDPFGYLISILGHS